MTVEFDVKTGTYTVKLDCACCKGYVLGRMKGKGKLNEFFGEVVPDSEIVRINGPAPSVGPTQTEPNPPAHQSAD